MADVALIALCLIVPVLAYGLGYVMGKAHRTIVNHVQYVDAPAEGEGITVTMLSREEMTRNGWPLDT